MARPPLLRGPRGPIRLADIATWIGDTIFYGVGWIIGLERDDHILLMVARRGRRDPDGSVPTVSRWKAIRPHLLFAAIFFTSYVLYAYLTAATLVAFSGGVDYQAAPIAFATLIASIVIGFVVGRGVGPRMSRRATLAALAVVPVVIEVVVLGFIRLYG